MNLAKISKEFDEFFEFTTEDRTQVSSVSCKLFADHCVIKAIENYKSGLVPVAFMSSDENHMEWRRGSLLELGFKDDEINSLYALKESA